MFFCWAVVPLFLPWDSPWIMRARSGDVAHVNISSTRYWLKGGCQVSGNNPKNEGTFLFRFFTNLASVRLWTIRNPLIYVLIVTRNHGKMHNLACVRIRDDFVYSTVTCHWNIIIFFNTSNPPNYWLSRFVICHTVTSFKVVHCAASLMQDDLGG